MPDEDLLDEDEELDEPEEQGENTVPTGRERQLAALKPWQFQPGKSGNPGGRPKGSVSLKTYARMMLESMTEAEAMEFMKGIDKKTVWEMAEGKPDAKIDGDIRVNAASVLFEDDEEETPTSDSVVPDSLPNLGPTAPVQSQPPTVSGA